MVLTIPRPQLNQEDAIGNQLAGEQPIALTCEPVTFPDGTLLDEKNALAFGFLLYRKLGSVTEVWDEPLRQWITVATQLPEYQTLFRQNNQWQTLLIAIGQEDQDKKAKFAYQTRYQYQVRCYFRGQDAEGLEHEGISPASPAYQILAPGERDRAGLKLRPESPQNAEEIRLFLKNEALTNEQGKVVIRQAGRSVVVELIGNQIELVAGGAKVTLQSDGDIILDPAPGREVNIPGSLWVASNMRVEGDLQVTGRINGVTFPVRAGR